MTTYKEQRQPLRRPTDNMPAHCVHFHSQVTWSEVNKMAAFITRMSLLCLLLISLFFAGSAKKSKPITTSLETKWPLPPIIVEGSEFLAEKSNDKFWMFFQNLAELHEGQVGSRENRSDYELLLKFAGQLLTSTELSLLKFALSVHHYAPRIEMYNQIANDLTPPQDCPTFIDVYGIQSCTWDYLQQLLDSASERSKPDIYKLDHKYPGGTADAPVVILYGRIDDWSSKIYSFHRVLKALADNGQIQYIFRHYISRPSARRVRLSGYGVELAIKSTEYKAVDDSEVKDSKTQEEDEDSGPDEVEGFVFTTLKERYPSLTSELNQFRQSLLDSSNAMEPLKVWQLQSIAFQAAQRVMMASEGDRLKVLRDVSQNFPLLAHSLIRTQVKPEFKTEIEKNQKVLAMNYGSDPGDCMIMINGLVIDSEIADPFMLFDLLQSEGSLMEGLYTLGLHGDTLNEVMKTKIAKPDGDFALDIRDHGILYINDIESDPQYKRWPSNVQEMLRPVFPGMMRQVKRNFFHMVHFVNPTSPDSLLFFEQAVSFLEMDFPVRLGFVFVVSDEDEIDGSEDAGVAIMRLFNFLLMEEGNKEALEFMVQVYEQLTDESGEGEQEEGEDVIVTADHVISVFKEHHPGEDIQEIIGADTEYDDKRKAGKVYFDKTALSQLPQVLVNGVPIDVGELNPVDFEDAVVTSIMHLTPDIQRDVYRGKLRDSTNILDHIMEKPNVIPRLNKQILSPENPRFIDLTGSVDLSSGLSDEKIATMKETELTAAVTDSMKYITKRDDEAIRPVSVWVVADLSTQEGRGLYSEAVKHAKASNNVRIGVIHNTAGTDQHHWLVRAVQAALHTQSRNNAKNFIVKLLKDENFDAINTGKKNVEEFEVHGMDLQAFQKAFDTTHPGSIQFHQPFCAKVLNVKPGQRAVVANGKVIGPLKNGEDFITEDFNLVENVIKGSSAEAVKKTLTSSSVNLGLEGEEGSTFLMRVDSLLASNSREEQRQDTKVKADKESVIKIPPADANAASFDIFVVLDPLTRHAQKWSHILMVLSQAFNVNLRIVLNPQDMHSEMPMKSFYRYVLEPEITFRVDNSFSSGPTGRFNDMPQDTLLTMNVLTPESWLVESVRTIHDLDNIKLSEVENSILAEYELEHLLLEGHCFEQNTGQPPRGLQFTLGTKAEPVKVDTIVMANLGYFQLKSNPGANILRLRSGRSSEIYEISSFHGTDSPPDSEETIALMDSFKSKIIRVKVNKKPGKEGESLLSTKEEDKENVEGGIWDSLQSSFASLTGKEKGTKSEESDEETLNIFSLASGHLYERLLRIMMLSVLKNTQSKVKFWFLKNHLSPTFKEFIPYMAEEYGFEFELVQYKWPRWLNQQTEKQRIIWAYKILFLDVLFPLSVKKIIFVDADQIVRADLQELADFNLKGAPYGYTPFCDSRKEMDGFRFWKSGYWANHLAGRKYHISALYVVDLVKFRKIAAGDRLRGQYQSLSQDPNSLSNLDQDLPNNMIHQVAIRSLPQEWLWCETWCSDSELANAKTIDLCNNPLTKEPKLQAAVRIVPEWTDYDNEIKQLQKKVLKKLEEEADETDEDSATGKDVHGEL
ncbi:UDP-glucose:glycoprotein glucosyltransferase 1 [Holothuria leucospilota]|uniref:UDP-glucose:glycoprotein glucosyltransferase 1 n=1 Tax=Holothuria leucospilota TaxID=206669 RepID=A0A9Q1BQ18_HOLLE|nr:UDP-glucose:glycoprotein glucosyltransferase 1 [Holothuria leucospilota]